MNRISLLFLFLLGSIQFSYGQAANFVKGAVIVLESKGLVQASDSTGKLITNGLSSGTVLSDGFSLSTGLSGQLTILLSNGIVATIEPESKLSLLTFLQKSFEPNNLTLDSMDKEPTESITKIVVEYGSVILLSKKLSQSSQFEISTQAGTTKILGTAFRIEQDALGVSKVDVTDSTVSFTPTGKGQPILLTEGKGLDVTTDGIAAQREVDASVNKLVNEVNNLQSKLSSSISLSILKSAVNKAQGLSPNSLPPKSKPSTSSTEDKTRDDDMVYAPLIKICALHISDNGKLTKEAFTEAKPVPSRKLFLFHTVMILKRARSSSTSMTNMDGLLVFEEFPFTITTTYCYLKLYPLGLQTTTKN